MFFWCQGTPLSGFFGAPGNLDLPEAAETAEGAVPEGVTPEY